MERNFFMVWVGDTIPEYAKHAFSAFKDMNPSFSCDFIQCEHGNPGVWKRRLENYRVKGCLGFAKCVESDDPSHRCMLSNLIRYWLVQSNGGIYADCDMFPIRPFDELAILDRPFKITKVKPPAKFITDDINLFGCPRGRDAQDRPVLLFPIKLYDFDNPKYLSLRSRFFSCAIEIGEYYNNPDLCFTDHYDSNTYGRNKRNPDTRK